MIAHTKNGDKPDDMQKEKCQQKAVADARRPRLVADDVAHLNERSVNNPGRHIDASHSKPCSRIHCVGNYWQRERLSQQQPAELPFVSSDLP